MRSAPSWIRRGLVVALLAAGIAAVIRVLGPGSSGGAGPVPTIGGDTWPPVPVKEIRAT